MRSSRRQPGLKQKLYLVYHEDGLLEVVIGACLLILAGVFLFEGVVFIGLIGIPAALYLPLKQQVALPRIGHIRFSPEEETRMKLILLLVLGLAAFVGMIVVVPLLKGLSVDIFPSIEGSMPLVFGVLLGAVLAGVGFFLNNARFYWYGLFGLILISIAYLTGGRVGISLALLGVVVEGIGIVYLSRFVRKYPVLADGQDG